MKIRYECNSSEITPEEWDRLTRNSTPYPEKELRVLINKYCPGIARKLVIDRPDLYNPYSELCAETPTHFIYVHSAIEYFFEKIE